MIHTATLLYNIYIGVRLLHSLGHINYLLDITIIYLTKRIYIYRLSTSIIIIIIAIALDLYKLFYSKLFVPISSYYLYPK